MGLGPFTSESRLVEPRWMYVDFLERCLKISGGVALDNARFGRVSPKICCPREKSKNQGKSEIEKHDLRIFLFVCESASWGLVFLEEIMDSFPVIADSYNNSSTTNTHLQYISSCTPPRPPPTHVIQAQSAVTCWARPPTI